MNTTDTTALQERIKRALWESLPDVSEEDYGSVEPWLDRDAAAVLPIIREAQAEALRETADWWAANPDDDVFETDGDTRNWLRDVATEYETGDSDEHR